MIDNYKKQLIITGSRGIPAKHGGFETLVHNLAPYLASKGWDVTVYCQEPGTGRLWEDIWNNVHRVHVPQYIKNPYGSVIFDLLSINHAGRINGIILTLGYNTALFNIPFKFFKRFNIIHMDGMEWQRDKWNKIIKLWFRMNERMALIAGNILIADHPEIAKYLKKITKNEIVELYYGANLLNDVDATPLSALGLEPYKFCLVIARPEPENSILEIIEAWSCKKRGMPLVVLGDYSSAPTQYTKKVQARSSDEVIFPGAIYNKRVVEALRYYCKCYVHGHTVGGTNPSLVEAMGASNLIFAQNNKFNRWVTGHDGAIFFDGREDLEHKFSMLLSGEINMAKLRHTCIRRFNQLFTWQKILENYENFLNSCLEKLHTV